MPTGYTSDVQDGKIVDFKVFALRCARAFGALIEMRDDPLDAPIKKSEVSSYYTQKLIESKEQYKTISNWSLKDASLNQQNEVTKQQKATQKRNEQKDIAKQRYNAMLLKVKEWDPPTSEHIGLKDFMIKQLEESIDFDCKYFEDEIKILSPQEYKIKEMQRITDSIDYFEKEKTEEEERVNKRNKWVEDLRKSLENT